MHLIFLRRQWPCQGNLASYKSSGATREDWEGERKGGLAQKAAAFCAQTYHMRPRYDDSQACFASSLLRGRGKQLPRRPAAATVAAAAEAAAAAAVVADLIAGCEVAAGGAAHLVSRRTA